jgi:poly(3-hydroxybutyrate) depolymerase
MTGTGGSTVGSGGSTSGAAGSTGAGGVTGTAGMTGTGGVAAGTAGGSGGMGTGGSAGPVMSMGCGMENTDSPTKWTVHNTMVTVPAKYTVPYAMRMYWTRPPANYDSNKPYNLIVWGQGCGLGSDPDPSIPPTENPEAAASSIIVELDPTKSNPTGGGECFSAGPDGDNADSPEIAYFDQLVSEVENEFCINRSHVFMGGYSSGGWFSALMSCVRANVIHGTGWAAAGLQHNHATCMGPVPALITRATMDTGTPLDQTMDAVENLRVRNGCGTTTTAWKPTWNAGEEMADTSSCMSYDGCMAGYPLIWCPTMGGHTNTEGDTHLTRDGLWKLWSTLPN